jgi:hypothetical protein
VISTARCASDRRARSVRGEGRLGRALAVVTAFLLGGAVSLFTAGPALFADGAFAERPPVLAVSVIAFFVIGGAIGYLAPGAWRPAAVALAISGIPAVLFFGRDVAGQMSMELLAVGFALGDAAAGVFGTWTGARLRLRRG